MTGTDPAIQAATPTVAFSDYAQRADARIAITAVRHLHRKAAIFEHVDGCDNPDVEHERLWHFETANGEMVCEHLPILGWTCSECADVASGADDLPEWPCDTARLIYTSEELNHA